MKVLGIDPGVKAFGYSVLEEKRGKQILIDYGNILARDNLSSSLKNIYKVLNKVIKLYKPDIFAIEEIFFNKNMKTAISVAEARGVAILSAANCKIEVVEYTPLQIKLSVVGYGGATKQQVRYMVKKILNLKDNLPYDVTDAIAVAICYLNSYKIREKIDFSY